MYQDFDHYTDKIYGKIKLDTYEDKTAIDSDVINDIDSTIRALMFKNKDNYNHLFDIMSIEYDPISNYDRVEESTHTEGQRIDSHTYGQHTDTETLGASSGTTTNSAQHSYTEDKVVGDNATTGQLRERTDANSDQYTNSYSNNSVTNSTQYGSRTDGDTKGQQINSINSHISGNVGVTTSQEMALSESKLWNYMNFYFVLIKDIVEAIGIPIYVEE